MATFLTSLLPSPDVSRTIRKNVDSLIPQGHMYYPIPPGIPLEWSGNRPENRYLETLRKTGVVRFSSGNALIGYDHGLIWVKGTLEGPDRLNLNLQSRLERVKPIFPIQTAYLVGALEGVSDPPPFPVPYNGPLFSTEAFWLSLLEIETDSSPWWEGVSWRLWYSRRIIASR